MQNQIISTHIVLCFSEWILPSPSWWQKCRRCSKTGRTQMFLSSVKEKLSWPTLPSLNLGGMVYCQGVWCCGVCFLWIKWTFKSPPSKKFQVWVLQDSPEHSSRWTEERQRGGGVLFQGPVCNNWPYLIFVIFFTRTKFLKNKIYTEKRQFLR